MAEPRPGFLSWDFCFDELGQQRQGFLPTQVARLGRNGRGYSFLRDVQFRPAEDLLQDDRRLHFAGQRRDIECAVVSDALVRLEFEIRSAKGVAFAVAEISERHLVRATDFPIDLMDLTGETIRRKPFGHRVGIQECTIDPLRSGA